MDMKHWLTLANRVRAEGAYGHAEFARDLVGQLTWHGAVDVATVLRSFVYGQPGGSELHRAVEPLYRRLGWEQAALIAAWFRDARNRPQKRRGGWPVATASDVEQQHHTRTESPVIPLPHRQKGGAPQLGARHPGGQGPFGIRPEPGEDHDLDDQDDETTT